jgi:VWFA-related protein
MKRGIAVVLLCVPVLFGQKKPASGPGNGSAPHLLFFDAVVTGADGRPVAGLTAEDFELTQTGASQKIASLTWFDNRQHVSTPGSPATPSSEFDFSPSDVRRKIVLLVDDFGLTPERVATLQNQLRRFVQQLAPEEYAAILRVSSNSGGVDLTSDRHALAAEIEAIQPAGRGFESSLIASAVWESLRSLADGLFLVPGRKSVVLVSDHLDAPLTPAPGQEFVRTSLGFMAHAAAVVFYTVDPHGSVQPPEGSSLSWLVKETGGLPAPDLDAVLRDQGGFYVVGFQPAQDTPSPTPAVLRLRGKILGLRWRFGYLHRGEARLQEIAPLDRAIVMQRALTGSSDARAIRTRMTSLYTGFGRTGAVVEVLVHLDAGDLSSVRDLNGKHHLSADVQVVPYSTSGRLIGATPQNYTITADDQEYQRIRKEGFKYVARLAFPSPGGYQIRAIVTDGFSDRVGSAMQFVEVPATNRGRFALSGLLLRRAVPAAPADKPTQAPPVQSAETVFRRDAPIAFSYAVFNAVTGPAQESHLQIVSRVFAGDRTLYVGRPIDLLFPEAGTRQVNSKLQFDDNLSPGTYLLEVEVTDLLAKDPQPRVAIQSATFEVRE